MGRPARMDADYFPHGIALRDHVGMKALRRKHKLIGYAVYCMMMEVLAASHLQEFEMNDLQYELLAGDFQVDELHLREILAYMLKLNLFQYIEGKIRSQILDDLLRPLWTKRITDLDCLRREASRKKNARFDTVEFPGVSESETLLKPIKNRKEEEEIIETEKIKKEEKRGVSRKRQKPSLGIEPEFLELINNIEQIMGDDKSLDVDEKGNLYSLYIDYAIGAMNDAVEILSKTYNPNIGIYDQIFPILTKFVEDVRSSLMEAIS